MFILFTGLLTILSQMIQQPGESLGEAGEGFGDAARPGGPSNC